VPQLDHSLLLALRNYQLLKRRSSTQRRICNRKITAQE
jgi:hypothetical protein